jgi:hypothetical protein
MEILMYSLPRSQIPTPLFLVCEADLTVSPKSRDGKKKKVLRIVKADTNCAALCVGLGFEALRPTISGKAPGAR